MKILIVDDEPLVRKSLSRAFKAKGHEVVEAIDGHDGLKAWLTNKPDAVLLDVLMPGLSGPEVIKEVKHVSASQSSNLDSMPEPVADPAVDPAVDPALDPAPVRRAPSRGSPVDDPPNSESVSFRKTRVILMSAYSGEHHIGFGLDHDSSEADHQRASQLGVDLFIPKPFDNIFAVVTKVEELFGKKDRG